jgi:hypothetical protein
MYENRLHHTLSPQGRKWLYYEALSQIYSQQHHNNEREARIPKRNVGDRLDLVNFSWLEKSKYQEMPFSTSGKVAEVMP